MSVVANVRATAREMSETTTGWPIERVVSLLAGSFTLLSLGLARYHDPRWRFMTGLIGTNLVMQAAVGWCPASLGMRILGLRTARETAAHYDDDHLDADELVAAEGGGVLERPV